MGWGYDWFGFPELLFGLLSLMGTVVFWVVVIALVVKIAQRRPVAGSGTAIETLEERYARGEIDREEFLERKAVLEGQVSS